MSCEATTLPSISMYLLLCTNDQNWAVCPATRACSWRCLERRRVREAEEEADKLDAQREQREVRVLVFFVGFELLMS